MSCPCMSALHLISRWWFDRINEGGRLGSRSKLLFPVGVGFIFGGWLRPNESSPVTTFQAGSKIFISNCLRRCFLSVQTTLIAGLHFVPSPPQGKKSEKITRSSSCVPRSRQRRILCSPPKTQDLWMENTCEWMRSNDDPYCYSARTSGLVGGYMLFC